MANQSEQTVQGVIVPVIRYNTSRRPEVYVVEHNRYQEDGKLVEEGQFGFLSETYQRSDELWQATFSRCLSEELGIIGEEVLARMRIIGNFIHLFSPKSPNNNGYRERKKYEDYFYHPTGRADVVVMSGDDFDILPTGPIGTREVRSAGYIPVEEIYNLTQIRQSYNIRIIMAEMQALGII